MTLRDICFPYRADLRHDKIVVHVVSRGAASFAANVEALAAAGAKVIVDDITLFTHPFFQDGIVAQVINSVAGRRC